MVNGDHDYIYPLEESQKPLFNLLGTEHKFRKTYPGGHGLWGFSARRHKTDILEWLDQHVGFCLARC